MSRVVWAITGSGSFLRELTELFIKFKNTCSDLEIAVVLSRAGKEVSRIYGVLSKLQQVASRTRYGGFYTDDGPAAWLPILGRVSLRRYDSVIVAPATSNTVAKIVHGIADTLITALVSQALKSGTPIVVLPSDYAEESVTQLPCRVDVNNCTKCYECLKVGFCPYRAIILSGEYPAVDYSRCWGCSECVLKCPSGTIKCWEEVIIRSSKIDLENVFKLKTIKGIHVVCNVAEVAELLRKYIMKH